MMRFVDVLNEQRETLDKLEIFSDRTIDGHAPGITGNDVQAYRAAGVMNDHECATAAEGLKSCVLVSVFWCGKEAGARNLRIF